MALSLREGVATWLDVRAAAGKLDKRRCLAELFAVAAGADLTLAVTYLAAEPAHVLGFSWAQVSEALARAGDPGGEPLVLVEVEATLAAVAAEAGPGSIGRRWRSSRPCSPPPPRPSASSWRVSRTSRGLRGPTRHSRGWTHRLECACYAAGR